MFKNNIKKIYLMFLTAFLFAPFSASAGKVFSNPLNPGKTGEANSLAINEIVGRVIFILLSLLGIISVVAIIFSGLRIAFARGNDDMVKKGKSGLVWAVIGLLVAFLGYVMINFVLGQLTFLEQGS